MKEDEADALVAAIVQTLQRRREELGMSLNKLGELAGMSHVGVLRIEAGERSPQLRTALKLATALDIRLSEIIQKSNPLFPALRSGPTAGSGAYLKSKFLAAGDSAFPIAANVSDEESVKKMMQELKEKFGGIHYLVNNAGIIRDKTVAKMALQEWQDVLDVNLTGVFLCSKYGVEIMHDGGAIVSISSLSGQMGGFGQANYAAAKAGVIGLTRTLHREFAKRGIRVNAIAPGLTKTTITKDIPEEYLAKMLEQIPLKRQAEPEEMAKVAAFLCSDLASYVTGQTLSVNGGWYPS